MHSFKSDEFKIRVLTKDDAEEYNALLRYAFQVTEADLAETGWKDDEIKQSKFPVLERADVLGCFNIIDKKEELVAQFAVYPLDMNIYGERYEVGFVTSVCTYPEYTGHGLMKKLMRKSLTRMRDSNKSFCPFVSILHTSLQRAWLGDYLKQDDICDKGQTDSYKA